jgi:hypothetical protein
MKNVTTIKKIIDSITVKNLPLIPDNDENVMFCAENKGTHMEIYGELSNCKVKKIHVQYNHYKLFVSGKVQMKGGELMRFKKQWKLPVGARKSLIEADFQNHGKVMRIFVPIRHGHVEENKLLSSGNDDELYSICSSAS